MVGLGRSSADYVASKSKPFVFKFGLCRRVLKIASFPRMAHEPDAPEKLWQSYASVFRSFDDLTLARWMAQTLGQLQGGLWRLSHPLVASYRLAAQVGHERQVWHQRMVSVPADYRQVECCRAPLLPMVTRDLLDNGLICIHCNGTAVELDDLGQYQNSLKRWAKEYQPIHEVAHWDDTKRQGKGSYEQSYEQAADEAEKRLAQLGQDLSSPLLELYPAVIWEDQDECLQVRPEDIVC